ncbi:SpoIIE family protein phosphatase [Bacillus atrophaeus]|uniref:SpoIIE family protein phosphatase n=1 Tax=Bacillus atrophaeus TaxID=1452 RepID=UPI00227E3C74|nr:SpoIIE family protein phosphatase [Bacillus atrophaeus]MEC0883983.1 SpoIIE family protein phosphatase [Bacillus atrophaeus]
MILFHVKNPVHSTSIPIGMFERALFQTNTFTYKRGGRLLLYTDGVMDPADSDYLSPILKDHRNIPITKLKDKVIQSLNRQKSVYHKSDDECFILVDLK